MRRHSAAASKKDSFLAPEVDTVPVPAPTGGWNAIDPKANMEAKYAPVLDNWVPRPGYVELRGGFSPWAQSISTEPVESLMAYRPPGSAEKLFAATGGAIWDVSAVGGSMNVRSGFVNNRFQHLNFTPAGGSHYLLMVNGADPYTAYDGTTWTTPSISGVSSSTFIGINNFKRRIWFIQNNSTSAWFLGTDAISGTATQLDLGSLMSMGGYLMAMGNWTIDGGNGPDDYAAFITSKGQVILYKGTDPTNANAWALIGVFTIPPPLGRRCFVQLGSDLGIITLEGVIPISSILPFDPAAARNVAITRLIQNAMLQAANAGQNEFGWQMVNFPLQGLRILNVPIVENSSQVQFVINTMNGSWCRFVGWNANCFETYNNNLYFGDNVGNVNWAYSGPADLVSPIIADMQCAFNWFGKPGRTKRITMVQPLLVADGQIDPTISIDVDFSDVSPSSPVIVSTPVGAVFNSSSFNSSTFAQSQVSVTDFLSAEAEGHALAIRMKVNLSPSGIGGQSVFDTGTFDSMIFDGFGTDEVTLQVNAFNVVLEYGAAI